MYKVKKYEHITIIVEHLNFIEKMIVKHYDTEEYDNTLFLLNYIFTEEDMLELKKYYPKIIFYNLEHYSAHAYNAQSNAWRDILLPGLSVCAEIWDFLIDNKKYYPENLIDKYRFMPLRYVESDYHKTEKYIDLLFFGISDTNIRKKFVQDLTEWFDGKNYNTVIVNNMFGENLSKMIQSSKFMCDFPHYKLYGNTQNCARIFEALCNNVQVISYTDTNRVVNYFPGLIEIINPENGFDNEKTESIILNYKDRNISEEYKSLTYSNDAFLKYKMSLLDLA